MRFPSRLHLEGVLEVRARRLNDGFCCLIEGAAVQLHRGRCSFFVGVTIVAQRQAPLAVVRRQKSALHTATSHFYHDSYFCRFPFGLYINIAVGNFPFVVCNIFMLIRHLVARSHCCDSCACMHRSCSGCNMSSPPSMRER